MHDAVDGTLDRKPIHVIPAVIFDQYSDVEVVLMELCWVPAVMLHRQPRGSLVARLWENTRNSVDKTLPGLGVLTRDYPKEAVTQNFGHNTDT